MNCYIVARVLTAAAFFGLGGAAQAQTSVKLGVLNDRSGVYSDLTGEGSGGNMSRILTPEDARRVVGYWGDEGATWIKFYTTVSRAAAKAAIDEAHKRGMKVTGHLCSLTFREAVALGIDNLEHGLITNTDYDPQKRPDECPPDATTRLLDVELDSDAVRATFREMVAAKVPMTSTLAIWELYVPGRPPVEQPLTIALLTIVALLALAVVFPLVAGNIDFSVGATAASSMVLAAGLMSREGLPLAPTDERANTYEIVPGGVRSYIVSNISAVMNASGIGAGE